MTFNGLEDNYLPILRSRAQLFKAYLDQKPHTSTLLKALINFSQKVELQKICFSINIKNKGIKFRYQEPLSLNVGKNKTQGLPRLYPKNQISKLGFFSSKKVQAHPKPPTQDKKSMKWSTLFHANASLEGFEGSTLQTEQVTLQTLSGKGSLTRIWRTFSSTTRYRKKEVLGIREAANSRKIKKTSPLSKEHPLCKSSSNNLLHLIRLLYFQQLKIKKVLTKIKQQKRLLKIKRRLYCTQRKLRLKKRKNTLNRYHFFKIFISPRSVFTVREFTKNFFKQ